MNRESSLAIALTYARSLKHGATLKNAWRESKENTVEGMKEHGITYDEVGTLFLSYQTLATSLADSLLINLEKAKLIVVSSDKRDDAIGMLAASPMIMGSIDFALEEVMRTAKDEILDKKKNNG
mgnify:CR=1 FL=1